MSVEEILADKATQQKTEVIVQKLEEVAKNPQNEAKLVEVLSKIDKSGPMKKFREYWDKLPKALQWGLMRAKPAVGEGPLQVLIKFGLIEYKGHLNEDGSVNDKEIQKMGGLEKWALKYGIKIGQYFIPELRPIAPFIDPLMKLDKVKGDLMTRVRAQLRVMREEVDGQALLAQKPANDNAQPKLAAAPKPTTKPAEKAHPQLAAAPKSTPAKTAAKPADQEKHLPKAA